MPNRPTFEYNPLSYAYPDDESDKELFFLQASGAIAASHLRTVLLYWVNKAFNDGEEVWQVVRLYRKEGGGYKYVYPDLIVADGHGGREHEHEHSEPGQGIGNGNAMGNGHGHWHGHGYNHGHDRGFGHSYGYDHDRGRDQSEDDERGELVSLGTFTRDQREVLLECAEEIEYDERAEEQCLRWMGTLLDRMTDEGLVKRAVVDAIRGVVPALPSS